MIARWVLFGCAFFCTFASSGFAQAVTTVRYFGDSFRRSYYDCDAGASGTLLLFSTAGWGDFGFVDEQENPVWGVGPVGTPFQVHNIPALTARQLLYPYVHTDRRQAAGSGYTDSYSVIQAGYGADLINELAVKSWSNPQLLNGLAGELEIIFSLCNLNPKGLPLAKMFLPSAQIFAARSSDPNGGWVIAVVLWNAVVEPNVALHRNEDLTIYQGGHWIWSHYDHYAGQPTPNYRDARFVACKIPPKPYPYVLRRVEQIVAYYQLNQTSLKYEPFKVPPRADNARFYLWRSVSPYFPQLDLQSRQSGDLLPNQQAPAWPVTLIPHNGFTFPAYRRIVDPIGHHGLGLKGLTVAQETWAAASVPTLNIGVGLDFFAAPLMTDDVAGQMADMRVEGVGSLPLMLSVENAALKSTPSTTQSVSFHAYGLPLF
jgi:hypothetical protein